MKKVIVVEGMDNMPMGSAVSRILEGVSNGNTSFSFSNLYLTIFNSSATINVVIRLTEVELTTGSIAFRKPTVWANCLRGGLFFISRKVVENKSFLRLYVF